MNDLENVIEDAANDAIAPEETSIEVGAPGSGASDDEAIDTAPDASAEVADADPTATAAPVAEQDDFAKKYGLSAESVTGRENRIPYSRVKKIIQNKEKELETARAEIEKNFTPKIQEYEGKVRQYEERLTQVAQFEHILENDPKQFLQMLSQVPAYKEFFEYIASLPQPGQQGQPQQQQSYLDSTSMPQPDQTLSDGSKVYSLEGLAKRDEWLARQIEDRAVRQAEERLSKRYAPIEEQWQTQQRIEQALPRINKEIEEARTWPLFNEHEADIVAALRADRSLSLQGAYMKVVTPRLQSSRDEMRKSILAELKERPPSTAAPANRMKAAPATQTGPRDLTEIVREAAESLKG